MWLSVIARYGVPVALEQRLINPVHTAFLADLYRRRNPQSGSCCRSDRAYVATVRVTSADVAAEGVHVVSGSGAAR